MCILVPISAWIAGAHFTKGLSPDLGLKLRLLSYNEAKTVVLDLRGFHKAAKSRLWLSLPGSGLNFCKQRLQYDCHIFFSLQNLKCLKIKYKFVEHLPK